MIIVDLYNVIYIKKYIKYNVSSILKHVARSLVYACLEKKKIIDITILINVIERGFNRVKLNNRLETKKQLKTREMV